MRIPLPTNALRRSKRVSDSSKTTNDSKDGEMEEQVQVRLRPKYKKLIPDQTTDEMQMVMHESSLFQRVVGVGNGVFNCHDNTNQFIWYPFYQSIANLQQNDQNSDNRTNSNTEETQNILNDITNNLVCFAQHCNYFTHLGNIMTNSYYSTIARLVHNQSNKNSSNSCQDVEMTCNSDNRITKAHTMWFR